MMIEINLVPAHLRRKRRKTADTQSPTSLPKETVLGVMGVFLFCLVVVSGVLQIIIMTQLRQSRRLEREAEELLPQKVNSDRYVLQIKGLQEKLAPIEELLGNEDIQWSRKLNEISDLLPRGVWLNKLSLDQEVLLISGSAVTRNQIEVHTFNANLKDSEVFMRGVRDIEPGRIKTRLIKETTVADFTTTVDLK